MSRLWTGIHGAKLPPSPKDDEFNWKPRGLPSPPQFEECSLPEQTQQHQAKRVKLDRSTNDTHISFTHDIGQDNTTNALLAMLTMATRPTTSQNIQPMLSHQPQTLNHQRQHQQEHPMRLYEIPANPQLRTFDVLDLLDRVKAGSKYRRFDIGPVTLDAAFVVVDAKGVDQPIVFCSEAFERLTGYGASETLGRNCRFLQSPKGFTAPGLARDHVDPQAVMQLKKSVVNKEECQITCLNYRKGGEPFINLISIIPIMKEQTGDVDYFVGFQTDMTLTNAWSQATGPLTQLTPMPKVNSPTSDYESLVGNSPLDTASNWSSLDSFQQDMTAGVPAPLAAMGLSHADFAKFPLLEHIPDSLLSSATGHGFDDVFGLGSFDLSSHAPFLSSGMSTEDLFGHQSSQVQPSQASQQQQQQQQQQQFNGVQPSDIFVGASGANNSSNTSIPTISIFSDYHPIDQQQQQDDHHKINNSQQLSTTFSGIPSPFLSPNPAMEINCNMPMSPLPHSFVAASSPSPSFYAPSSRSSSSTPAPQPVPSTPNVASSLKVPKQALKRKLSKSGGKVGRPSKGSAVNKMATITTPTPHLLIENSPDFIHILSSRGIILYASSTASRELLNYDPKHLVGKNISEFCHEGDLTSLMRDLKGCEIGDGISVMYRFRCNNQKSKAAKVKTENGDSGNDNGDDEYVWLDVTGKKHEMANRKRTKCYILSGRLRTIGDVSNPALFGKLPNVMANNKNNTTAETSQDENEQPQEHVDLWAKISPEGLILFASPFSNPVFGVSPQELHAVSLIEMVHPSDRNLVTTRLQNLKASIQNGSSQYDTSLDTALNVRILQLNTDGGANTIRAWVSIIPHTRHVFYLRVTVASSPLLAYNKGSMNPGNEKLMGGGCPIGQMEIGEQQMMKIDRTSSLQFEMCQLKMNNKRIREELIGLGMSEFMIDDDGDNYSAEVKLEEGDVQSE
ncbi:blue light receptor [Blyttiomyces sp. JEL0837]|nr:blue light receptor [Blyttiomyces sp. JEL0837]